MGFIRILVVLLPAIFSVHLSAQPFFEPLTSSDVEAHLSYLTAAHGTYRTIPDPDSISRFRIRKSVDLVKIGSTDGHIGEGKVVAKYDKNGYLKSYREHDRNHPGSKTWETNCTYSAGYDRVLIRSSIDDSVTALDSVYFRSDKRVARYVRLLSGYTSVYSYLDGDGPLTRVVMIDSSGRKWITTIDYDSLERLSRYIQFYTDEFGKTDTLESKLILRDSLSRIVFAGNYSRYEVSWDKNKPDSLVYWRMGTYYEYNSSNQVIRSADYNIYSPQGLKHVYTYDEQHRLIIDENPINDSVTSKRFHYYIGTTDSIRTFTTYSNYLGRGPQTAFNGIEIIEYDKSGQWISWKKYGPPGFGITIPIDSVHRTFDDKGRLTGLRNYDYDFGSKTLVASSTVQIKYYRNGLEHQHSTQGKQDALITWSKKKYRYYWFR